MFIFVVEAARNRTGQDRNQQKYSKQSKVGLVGKLLSTVLDFLVCVGESRLGKKGEREIPSWRKGRKDLGGSVGEAEGEGPGRSEKDSR